MHKNITPLVLGLCAWLALPTAASADQPGGIQQNVPGTTGQAQIKPPHVDARTDKLTKAQRRLRLLRKRRLLRRLVRERRLRLEHRHLARVRRRLRRQGREKKVQENVQANAKSRGWETPKQAP